MEAEQKLRDELKELTDFISQPDAFSDPKIGEKNRRQAELTEIIDAFDERDTLQKHLIEANEILRGNDSELSELAKLEIPELEEKTTLVEERLTELLMINILMLFIE